MDNKIYNSDKKMEDQGWLAMRKMLDREMPVKRRRPFMLFWLLGVLLPLAGLLVWQMLRQDVVAPKQPANIPVAQLPAQEQSIKPKQTPLKTVGEASLSTANKAKSPNKLQTEKAIRTYPRRNTISSKQETNIESIAKQSKAKPEQPVAQAKSDTKLAASPKPLSEKSANQSPAPGNTNPVTPEKSDDISLASQPASLDLSPTPEKPVAAIANAQPLPEQEKAPENANPANPNTDSSQVHAPSLELPIDPVSASKKSTWAFGGTVGLLTDLSLRYTGFSSGLTAEWRTGKRWGFRTGLAYQFQSLRNEERPIVEVTTGLYADATGDPLVFDTSGLTPITADEIAAPIYIPVSRLHRLEVPLLAYWEPAPKLRVFGGLALGATLYAQSGDRSLKDNTVLAIQNSVANRNLNQEITTQVRDWGLRWTLGLGYRLGEHFSVDLFLHNPINFNRSLFAEKDQSLNLPSPGQESVATRAAAGRPTSTTGHSIFQFSASVFF